MHSGRDAGADLRWYSREVQRCAGRWISSGRRHAQPAEVDAPAQAAGDAALRTAQVVPERASAGRFAITESRSGLMLPAHEYVGLVGLRNNV
jgi:hypothetical protein